MHWMLQRLRNLHYLCVEQLIYPLALCSLLSVALFWGRVQISHQLTFHFLLWNLFLAWIPYLCSLGITVLHTHNPRFKWLLIVPGVLWLIFLPNAPYLVTDLLHLADRPPVPFWYDIGMFATFAWTGSLLGVVSLSHMQAVIRSEVGSALSWVFVLVITGLSGLGIYLGRFLQLNSWDLILNPQRVFANIVAQLAHPLSYPRPLGVTLLFAAFLLVCYVTFVSIEHRQAVYRETD